MELIKGPYSPIRNNTTHIELPFKLDLKENRFLLPNKDYLQITGRIDRIDEIDKNTIEITDYKSGQRSPWLGTDKTKKNSETLKKDIQAQIYYLAVKQLFPHEIFPL